MRLATMRNGTRDGALHLVARDGIRAASAQAVAPTLLAALEEWPRVRADLEALAAELEAGGPSTIPFDDSLALAPLPRTWQWLDASAFLNHGALLSRSLGMDPIVSPVPLMYQGMSHEFLAPHEPVTLWNPRGDLDFEGEFAVVLRETPAGIDADAALEHIALVTFVNDWSQRAIVVEEMGRKFGFIEGKPATTMAPVAATPDELGECWQDGRITATLTVALNGERFGEVPAGEMDYSFGELIAYAARTRNLAAGTVIGSGTVSSTKYAETGSACIAERRGIEIIQTGSASTPYLRDGDRVSMRVEINGDTVFGRVDQTVVRR
ncbi:fumarylacetoacetate hydrolase family protein [Microbacterium yannicii]|uniref:Fumarylacetoacetate hydrolase family protein n=2 Tax=Microbacterium yannicii TaxID=671622 RepID=A0ABP9M838_9MICO